MNCFITSSLRTSTSAASSLTSIDSGERTRVGVSSSVVYSAALRAFTTEDYPRVVMPQHGMENARYSLAFDKVGAHIVASDYKALEFEAGQFTREVESILGLRDHTKECSIPQQFVNAASETTPEGLWKFPCLRAIQQKAYELVMANDAVLLAGGISVHPSFYGEVDGRGVELGFYDLDPRRTLLEIFLIDACQRQDKPLLGICRGHQLINIYFGGRLHRDQVGELQLARVRKVEDVTGSSHMELPSTVYFNHRQSVSELGRGLRSFGKLSTTESVAHEIELLSKTLEEARATAEGDPDFFKEIGAFALFENAVKLLSEEGNQREKILGVLSHLASSSFVVALETTAGAPIIGVQFHPEAVVEESGLAKTADIEGNLSLLRAFVSMAKLNGLIGRAFSERS